MTLVYVVLDSTCCGDHPTFEGVYSSPEGAEQRRLALRSSYVEIMPCELDVGAYGDSRLG